MAGERISDVKNEDGSLPAALGAGGGYSRRRRDAVRLRAAQFGVAGIILVGWYAVSGRLIDPFSSAIQSPLPNGSTAGSPTGPSSDTCG